MTSLETAIYHPKRSIHEWQAVKVEPWIGDKYPTPEIFRYRTLIMGESNYAPDNLNLKSVIDDVKLHIGLNTNPDFSRFATKVRRLTAFDLSMASHELTRKEFWRNIAFYNFIQCLVGSKARQRPTSEMWASSVPAFLEIMEKLRPQRILVLGKANWLNLLSHVRYNEIDDFSVRVVCGGQEVVAGYTNHPSSSIAYEKWRPIVRKVLFEEM